MLAHPIPPVFNKDSKVLVLGSFPSVKSREEGFFYGHPQNRFWKVTARVFDEDIPLTVSSKREFLLRNHIALWDVIGSCDIEGSSDSSIRNVTVNDISIILNTADIRLICLNGKKAYQYYQKYMFPVIKREGICLPSTSPANAAWNIDRLLEAWSVIRTAE
ncbi:MAG: DNA-deoxyinosine glycosylase [Clostridiales bacterium]|nr:DNA-deoxyinosine glycosylase [Clostridiales bacterium]MBR2821889.1 DNA-deoxyinosine glycosylase [Clostridiales bacterium]